MSGGKRLWFVWAAVVAAAAGLCFPAASAADEALAAETISEEVQAAVTRLPEEFRIAVVLSDVVGLSYAEIGETLDVPIGTVRSRIHRARAELREKLQDLLREPSP